MVGQRAILRLLLVVLIAAGVASMHTLGHPSSGGHGGAQPVAHGGPEMPETDVAGYLTAMVVSGGGSVMRGPHLSLDPSTVCLAILVAFALAALLAALLVVGRRRPAPASHSSRAAAPAGRGPPPAARAGLRLATLSVLRI